MTGMNTDFDVIVLGGGPGGYVAALRAAGRGLKTALVEKEVPGGMCLNWGCIPSKALIQSARNLAVIRNAANWGITGIDSSAAKPDWTAMLKRSSRIVKKLTKGVEYLLKNNGVEIIRAEGRVLDRHRISAGGKELSCRHLIIATGSHYELSDEAASVPDLYTPRDIYGLKDLPESMTVIGAGNVGLEFALLFAALDVKVTVIDRKKKAMDYLDSDVHTELMSMLKSADIDLQLEKEAVFQDSAVIVKDRDGAEAPVETSVILWAPERRASLRGLEALAAEGMVLTEQGYVETDEFCRTNLNGVYAVGDVNGKIMLAHKASTEGSTAVDHIAGDPRPLNYDLIPYNFYAGLEIASIGLSEETAWEQKYDCAVGRFSFSANGKALAEDNARGFVKVIYEKKYGEILGVHIVSENATDLISEAAVAMQGESTIWDLALTTHPHPTLSEAVLEAGFKGLGKPLHTL